MKQQRERAIISIRPAVTLYFGDEGERWLDRLPELLAEFAEKWGLRLEEPFENLSINYVTRAIMADGEEAVLKLGVPSRESRTESEALRAFWGRGAVEVLQSNPQQGALLLERVRPGVTARGLPGDEAVGAVAGVIRRLHREEVSTEPEIFPTLADWFEGLDRYRVRFREEGGPISLASIDRASSIAAELLDSTERPILLHGDLHHDNVLFGEEEGWRAIDPKGVVGDPCFEVAPFLRNPVPEIEHVADREQTRARRLDLFEELLGYDRERMRMWGEAEGVLSAVWDVEK